MQSTVYPNATFHSRTRALSGQLEWCESDDKSRDYIACLGRKNRYRYDFIDNLILNMNVFLRITDLLGFD